MWPADRPHADRPHAGRRRRVAAASIAAVLAAGGIGAGVVLLLRQGAADVSSPAAAHHRPSPSGAAAASSAPNPAPPTRPASSRQSPRSAPPTPASFAALYAEVGDGVVKIQTTTCDGGVEGSGFLVAPDLVATVAHVVAGAQAITVKADGQTTTGTVVGYDPAHELALVRAATAFPGHVFTLAGTDPQVGDDVAAIGFPLAGDESLTKGSVSGLHRQLDVDGRSLTDLLQTDTPINPGNSGGPLVTVDGGVVGLVEAKTTDAENMGYAVPAADAAATLAGWRADPVPVRFTSGCGASTGPGGITADVTDNSGSPDGPAIATMFQTYAGGINSGDFAAAYAELSPHAQRLARGLSAFASGEASSYLYGIDILSVTRLANGDDQAHIQFTSTQETSLGGTGQSCSDWRLTYTLTPGGDAGWQIDQAVPDRGYPTPC